MENGCTPRFWRNESLLEHSGDVDAKSLSCLDDVERKQISNPQKEWEEDTSSKAMIVFVATTIRTTQTKLNLLNLPFYKTSLLPGVRAFRSNGRGLMISIINPT